MENIEKGMYWDAVDNIIDFSCKDERYIQQIVVEIISKLMVNNIEGIDSNYSDLNALEVPYYLTTNYDNLLGINITSNYQTIILNQADVSTQQWAKEEAKKRIIHLHGTIANTGSIVLSRNKYEEIYKESKYVELFNFFRSGYTFIFLGFSFSDQYIMKLMKEYNSIFNDYHYILLPNVTKEIKKEYMDKYKLHVIGYNVSDMNNNEEHITGIREILQLIGTGKEKNMVAQNDKNIIEDKIYLNYIKKWCEFIDIDNWNGWTSWMLGSGQPGISQEMFKRLGELREWLYSRIWPGKYNDIEGSFTNFRYVLNDLYNIFNEHCQKRGEMYQTEKFYKNDRWDSKQYDKLSKEFDYHVDLVQDLILELTRAANYICDNVRKFILPEFRLEEGKLLVTYGPCNDFTFKTICPEYKDNERILMIYPGLDEFKIIRVNRDFGFGIGISPEDPKFLQNR